jgi:aconitate hydratase 2/2-methylisocitrate dehydratase
VYLTSAELAAVGALLGKLPTPDEYREYAGKIDSMADEIYRYMNFDQVVAFQKLAEDGGRIAATIIDEVA